MRLMHTKLPEFLHKMHAAGERRQPQRPVTVRGLEHLRTCNLQSLRTGRIEEAVEQLAALPGAVRIEVVLMPRVPETMHTVVVKALGPDDQPLHAVLEVINILHPTEEVELAGCPQVDDRRPPLGKH